MKAEFKKTRTADGLPLTFGKIRRAGRESGQKTVAVKRNQGKKRFREGTLVQRK